MQSLGYSTTLSSTESRERQADAYSPPMLIKSFETIDDGSISLPVKIKVA